MVTNEQDPPEEAVAEVQALAREVLGQELPPRAARELAGYPAAYVRDKMKLARTAPGVRNPVGWAIEACRGDWAATPAKPPGSPPRDDPDRLDRWLRDKYADLYLS